MTVHTGAFDSRAFDVLNNININNYVYDSVRTNMAI